MRQALTAILPLFVLAACSGTPVEPTTAVAQPQFASTVATTAVSGFLRFPDGASFRIAAQSLCDDVCTFVGSVALRNGSDQTRFDVADLQVTGGLLPWYVTAASRGQGQSPLSGDYKVELQQIRPRDCEGPCPSTWTIDVLKYSVAFGWGSIYRGTSDSGSISVSVS